MERGTGSWWNMGTDERWMQASFEPKQKVCSVFWGFRGPTHDTDEVAAAVQQDLSSAQEGHEWPDEMPDGVRQQIIMGDGKCTYWALSAVQGRDGQAAADEVRRALTEGTWHSSRSRGGCSG